MKTYEIIQTESGKRMGTYAANSAGEAILAMAADAGADTTQEGWDRGLVAREVTPETTQIRDAIERSIPAGFSR